MKAIIDRLQDVVLPTLLPTLLLKPQAVRFIGHIHFVPGDLTVKLLTTRY